MKEMCTLITPYRCGVCNQDMLYFTTKYNTLIDYKNLMYNKHGIAEINNYLETKQIKFIKCLVCNKTYIIDWSEKYPRPVMNKEDIKKFMV